MVSAACALGTLAVAARPAAAQADPPSACRATTRVAAVPKLACPLERVEIEIQVQAACPDESGGPATLQAIEITLQLPEGIVAADGSSGGSPSTAAPPSWRFERPPAAGITVVYPIRPIRAGDYALGARLQVRIEDSLGRVATQQAAPDDDRAMLSVSGPCRPGKGASVYLPRVIQPRCAPSTQAADIVLLVDRSGSMGRGGLADAGRQAEAFFDGLNLARDRVAVFAFDQRVELRAPLGSGRAALERALSSLTLGPGTALDRAIEAGVAHLEQRGHPDHRRILVLLTDGVQTGPRGSAYAIAAADAARAQGIAILTVALGPAPNHALLQRISSQPAYAITAPEPGDLGQAFRDLAEVAVCATDAW